MLWGFINLSLMIYYIPLQNINIKPILRDYCQSFSLNIFGIVPDLDSILPVDFSGSSPADENNSDYGIESTNFFVNAGSSLLMIGLGLVLYPVLLCICILSKYCMRCLYRLLVRLLGQYKWNFFLRAFIIFYIELLFSGLVSLSTVRYM